MGRVTRDRSSAHCSLVHGSAATPRAVRSHTYCRSAHEALEEDVTQSYGTLRGQRTLFKAVEEMSGLNDRSRLSTESYGSISRCTAFSDCDIDPLGAVAREYL